MDTERRSNENEGTAAFENHHPGFARRDTTGSENSLDLLGNLAARLKAVEADNADMREQLRTAKSANTVEPYPGFQAHVAHVMVKHFHHDRPDADDASKFGG